MESCRPSSVSRSFFENNNQRTTPPTIDKKIVLANERRRHTRKSAKKKFFVSTFACRLCRLISVEFVAKAKVERVASARLGQTLLSIIIIAALHTVRAEARVWSSTHEKLKHSQRKNNWKLFIIKPSTESETRFFFLLFFFATFLAA